jgi:uncharacterized protein (UPF0276 family)
MLAKAKTSARAEAVAALWAASHTRPTALSECRAKENTRAKVKMRAKARVAARPNTMRAKVRTLVRAEAAARRRERAEGVVNRLGLENLGLGLGLRTVHYAHILEHGPELDWFEIISENYMFTAGRPLLFLDRIAERYPIVMHGVSLSIGSSDPLDFEYLQRLKTLRDRVAARWVSDHLCWTGVAGRNSHDLLPMPYTEEALRHVASRVQVVQDFMQAQLVLENPSTYVEFCASAMTESQFLRALCEQTGCGLLLDVNNVYFSAFNHGFDAEAYIDEIPAEHVVQYHVAGHSYEDTHIIDSHSGPVSHPVWKLLERAYGRADASVLLEWDAEIPPFEVAHHELAKARQFCMQRERTVTPAQLEHESSPECPT